MVMRLDHFRHLLRFAAPLTAIKAVAAFHVQDGWG